MREAVAFLERWIAALFVVHYGRARRWMTWVGWRAEWRSEWMKSMHETPRFIMITFIIN